MSGYIGTKAVLLSTTAASVTGNADIGGNLTVDTNTLFVDSTNNRVGVGTSSPAVLLDVAGSSGQMFLQNTDATANGSHDFSVTALKPGTGFNNFNIAGYEVRFKIGGASTEAMRIDSSGNVGIGTSSPAAPLDVGGNIHARGVSFPAFKFANSSGTALAEIYYGVSAGDLNMVSNQAGGRIGFQTAGSERMRIDASGNLLVGTTTTAPGVNNTTVGSAIQSGGTFCFSSNAITGYVNRNADGSLVTWRRSGAEVGSISITTSATSYNTSSDYRLKEDVQPMTGASDRVLALNPVNFAWKADGTRVDGFIAHEAQAVVPEAVTGTKDAMRTEEYEVTPAVEATYDEDGNELTPYVPAVMGTREVPDYQGIDQSKLVPLLTAALQEALNEIAALKDRVAALEAV